MSIFTCKQGFFYQKKISKGTVSTTLSNDHSIRPKKVNEKSVKAAFLLNKKKFKCALTST